MIYRIVSLAALGWIWVKMASNIGVVVDCRPIDAAGVLLFVAIMVAAWLLGFKSGRGN